jgi:signal transduction histidine kinase
VIHGAGPDIDRITREVRTELDAGRGHRIAVLYVLVASLWIVVGGVIVDRVARRTGAELFELELVKGLVFVFVTGAFLWRALQRWSVRMEGSARAERLAADRILRAEEMRRTFLAAISHELRTPLTAVSGYASTIEGRGDVLSDTQRHELAARLGANARRLERLVLDLLELDRLMHGLGHLRTEDAELASLARRVVAYTDVGDRHTTVEGDGARARVDVPKVERMLEHLLANVVRHTPADVSITVRVRGDDDAVHLEVADDGPGIAPELLDSIFDPFAQDGAVVASASPGIGIGLALVAEFAALHGGGVAAANRDCGGARFTVTLPRNPVA